MKKFAETPFLPTEVEIEAISANETKITAYPFEDGFAITLAHPLRRLLLSSSVGYAPIAVKIDRIPDNIVADITIVQSTSLITTDVPIIAIAD